MKEVLRQRRAGSREWQQEIKDRKRKGEYGPHRIVRLCLCGWGLRVGGVF